MGKATKCPYRQRNELVKKKFKMPLIEKIVNPLSTFHHKRIFMHLRDLDIDKIIDVGAHKGEFLENMLKIQKVNSFYAFEPQKNIFKELNKKFARNKKVKLFNCAIDKEISSKKLKINKISMKSSFVSKSVSKPTWPIYFHIPLSK